MESSPCLSIENYTILSHYVILLNQKVASQLKLSLSGSVSSLRETRAQIAPHYHRIGIKRLTISSSCGEDEPVPFQGLAGQCLSPALSQRSLRWSPEVLLCCCALIPRSVTGQCIETHSALSERRTGARNPHHTTPPLVFPDIPSPLSFLLT